MLYVLFVMLLLQTELLLANGNTGTNHHHDTQPSDATAAQIDKRVELEKQRAAFINAHNGGLWKAKVFMPIAVMDDRERALLSGVADIDEKEKEEIQNYLKLSTPATDNNDQGRKRRQATSEELPMEFDPRKEWPECAEVIDQIAQQGSCGCCWAVSAATAQTDRICIWRAKKLRAAFEPWMEFVRQQRHCLLDWHKHAKYLKGFWLLNKRVFAQSFYDTRPNQKIDDAEAEMLSSAWYNLLMQRWSDKKALKTRAFDSITEKLDKFVEFDMEMQEQCNPSSANDPKVNAVEMRNVWCERTGPKDYSGTQMVESILRAAFDGAADWKEKATKFREEYENPRINFLLIKKQIAMLEQKMLAHFDKPNQLLSEEERSVKRQGAEKLSCLWHEFVAGHWDYGVALDLREVPDGETRKVQKARIATVVGRWLRLLDFGDDELTPANMEQWKREMLEAFRAEAIKPHNMVSAFHLLTCAPSFILHTFNDICNRAGTEFLALLTGYNKGIISGSTVDSRQGCQPFSMLYARGRESSKCTNQCPGMGRLFSEDKVVEPWAKLFDVPKILGNYLRMPWQKRWSDNEVVTAMMRDIQQNGSIVASIKNGPSFNLYGGGIFLRNAEIIEIDNQWTKDHGGHAIRIVGWGEEDGVKYWLVANSWGREWGEQGWIRIARGVMEMDIEKRPAYANLLD